MTFQEFLKEYWEGIVAGFALAVSAWSVDSPKV